MTAMTSERGEEFGFAPSHDAPIPYIQRIRDYYVTLGYGAPYEWAHYATVPFQPLKKPLAEARVTLITTAAPYQPDKGDQGPGAPYNSAAKFYKVYAGETAKDHDLRISHVGIDRKHTTAEDSNTWFPLSELRRVAKRGRIGALAPRFFGLPTNRSHRVTLEIDCPEIVARCKEDGVDAALLLPNCPVCHQSASTPPTQRKRRTCSTSATRLCSNEKRRLGLEMKMSRLKEKRYAIAAISRAPVPGGRTTTA